MKKTLEIVRGTITGFRVHKCGLHAAGLTYFSLLAFVPMLCLTLLLAKTCGVGDIAREQINKQLDAYIAEIGSRESAAADRKSAAMGELADKAREISNELFDRADKFDASTLGWIGLAMLAWTVISTFGTIEATMNEIWGAERARPLWKKCLLYLFVALAVPIFAALALSMPVLAVVKGLLEHAAGYIPYSRGFMNFLVAVLVSKSLAYALTFVSAAIGFGIFYRFMPYCKVKTAWAMTAGAVITVIFAAWLKICISAQVGVANSSALYGSFAFLPIVLAWVYISWQILLAGGVLACQLQSAYSH